MEYWNPQQPPGCAATRRATSGLPPSWSSSFTLAAAVSVTCMVAPPRQGRSDYRGRCSKARLCGGESLSLTGRQLHLCVRGAETRVGSVTRHLGEVRLLPRSAVPCE